jgi:hypothetical protein
MTTATRTRTAITVVGTDPDRLASLRRAGIDVWGNVVEPFVDAEGGWPLRCCLRDSSPGDVLAIVAWCPMPWSGPFVEVGPIVIHHDACEGAVLDAVPEQLLGRPQLLRPYDAAHRIAYDHLRLVAAAESLPAALDEVLAHPEVAEVIVRNVLAGCYSVRVTRATPSEPAA